MTWWRLFKETKRRSKDKIEIPEAPATMSDAEFHTADQEISDANKLLVQRSLVTAQHAEELLDLIAQRRAARERQLP